MAKNIGYLGAFNINSTNYFIPMDYIVFENINRSLMDYDIILFNPLSFYSKYINQKPDIFNNISNKWEEKINLFIKNNNSIFIFLPRYYENEIINNINSYYIIKSLLIFENLKYETGSLVYKIKSQIFDNLYNRFKNNFIYNATYIDVKCSKIKSKTNNILCGKDKNRTLGSIIEIENGGRIFILPQIVLNEYKDLEDLQNIILEIDKKSRYNQQKTPAPEWTNDEIYLTEKSKNIINEINDNNSKINELNTKNNILNKELEKEESIKDLLFENGKPLENIIIEALKILDYEAENKIINDTEIDILATSPENDIFCCEVEGKDNTGIEVNKFRQLSDNLNVYEDEYPDSNPIGILFGNAFRLKPLEEREEEYFTKHCIERARKKGIILIKTSDLFFVIKSIKDCDNEEIKNNYKKKCREAILNSVGNIVSFPNINEQ